MLVGDVLKDKSENPFPYTTRIKLSHISQTPQKYTLKKEGKNTIINNLIKKDPFPKKMSNQKG